MNDNCSSNDVFREESICVEFAPYHSFISHKYRHITDMIRMRFLFRIVVPSRIFKRIGSITGTASAFMDMKTIKIAGTIFRKTGNMDSYNSSAMYTIELPFMDA